MLFLNKNFKKIYIYRYLLTIVLQAITDRSSRYTYQKSMNFSFLSYGMIL